MKYYAYKMGHDYGFAPNPFGGTCTLATCKPKIRMGANIGDWIIGTGSKKMGLKDHLIHIMEITEKLTFQEYWSSTKFEFKKPLYNGGLVRLYGDNIYYESKDGRFKQVQSFHSNQDGSTHNGHLTKDTNGKFVLLSTNFWYFGDKNFLVPKKYQQVCSKVRDTQIIKDQALALEFVDWIKQNYPLGINGFPINWREHRQLKFSL